MSNPFVYAFTIVFMSVFAFLICLAFIALGLSALSSGNIVGGVACALLTLAVLSVYLGALCALFE